ncbi:MAG TPA: cytochrome c-type biogenesis protein CcmH [Solirubrobacteraceae bacterium]|nr:cytochrome c-type biogenesis protein CcmH [Solirubrobacteraceae bacterium]
MTRTGLRSGPIALLVALLATPFALATGPLAATPAVASAAPMPRASLTDIEGDVMCVACREPLEVAQSPQADSERAYIRGLIAQGETKSQILDNLVAQYGPAVLGKPPARGFNLTVYVIPVAILALGAAMLAFTLPRWRRRTRAAARERSPTAPALDPADAQRLDQELSQFRG